MVNVILNVKETLYSFSFHFSRHFLQIMRGNEKTNAFGIEILKSLGLYILIVAIRKIKKSKQLMLLVQFDL